MDIFNNILLFLHFFGLAMGMGSGLALSNFGPFLAKADREHRIRSWGLYRTIARTAHIGLGLLIVTGLILVFTRYGGPAGMSWWFWLKMAFVVILVVSIAIGTRAARRLENGDAAAAAVGKRAGMVNGISGLAVILSAVFAFN